MLGNIKYYVVTVVSIFLALAIGIYIGFMFDAQDIMMSQKEDIVSQLENSFNYLREETETVKKEIIRVTKEKEQLVEFNRAVYGELIKDRLSGIKIAVIETSDDYIYNNIVQTIELAGAEVVSITTIKDNFSLDLDVLDRIFKESKGVEKTEKDIVKQVIDFITEGIIKGEDNGLIEILAAEGLVDYTSNYAAPVDYMVIAGGRKGKDYSRFETIDKRIIDICKKNEVPIIGIEKEEVEISYIEKYKDNRISSVDNIDSILGKVAFVFAIDGRPGNYGVKPSAESLVPELSKDNFY
ncbi:Copper transport outer membrane protein, MctB [Proteiniborus ethanoligenes]|uniref:Copper transport outer membrane protein, MctB n=1 Tax=Proteiniborus ethanoligenes TaxID=415015 RepID=A0A1H3K9Q6_9FIRM|nr:copper transporter [Proteiniborus ethanoligenes]SDY48853.1 Copper transport outer membrane protein, MctB [Proteiniborus ethanoligenes]